MTAIPAEMIARWQSMVNILAELLDVPAGLIMQAEPPNHRVVVSSKTPQNPYAEGTSFVLHTGLYCDTVMEANADLLVHDAAASKQWRNNPDLEHGMSFYHGFPLSWPNGRIFGTICVLDRKDNPKAARYRDLLAEFKASIDVDLTLLVTIDEKMQLMEELRAGQDLLEERVKQRTAELGEVNATLRVLLRQLEVTRGEFELQVTDSLAERSFLTLQQSDRPLQQAVGFTSTCWRPALEN